jgi:hypothetical protein
VSIRSRSTKRHRSITRPRAVHFSLADVKPAGQAARTWNLGRHGVACDSRICIRRKLGKDRANDQWQTVTVEDSATDGTLRVVAADDGLSWINAFWFARYAFRPDTELWTGVADRQQPRNAARKARSTLLSVRALWPLRFSEPVGARTESSGTTVTLTRSASEACAPDRNLANNHRFISRNLGILDPGRIVEARSRSFQ